LLANRSGSSRLSGSTKRDKPNQQAQFDNSNQASSLSPPASSRLYSSTVLADQNCFMLTEVEAFFQRVDSEAVLTIMVDSLKPES
jgi:hypothetical protein